MAGKKSLAQDVLKAAGRAERAGLERLKERGADLNAEWRGYRAIHALIQREPHAQGTTPSKKELECLAWLLENGADPKLPAAWPPMPALIVAAFWGPQAYVDALLEGGAKRDGFAACALGDLVAVKKTLAKDAGFAEARAAGGLTALQCCAGSKRGRDDAKIAKKLLEIASVLLDAGADPNAKTKSWSHEIDVAYLACSSANRAMLELLLDRGADATAALPSAAWRKTMELAELCLERGAEIDRAEHDGKPLLNQLVRWGQVKPALWLLERGASPNLPDERGWTAVHQAASRGNERMLRACLAAGGDPFARDKAGLVPAQVALLMRKPKLAAILA
jgi:ankyrin repeat protein